MGIHRRGGAALAEPRPPVWSEIDQDGGRGRAWVAPGEIEPMVAKTYPLKEIVRAQQEFLAKQLTGKIVLIP